MSKVKIKKEDLENIVWGDESDESGNFILEEKCEWGDEGKYQYRDFILKHKDNGKHYLYALSRSGSYFSDYHYGLEDEHGEITLNEVEKTEKVIVVWTNVKEDGE